MPVIVDEHTQYTDIDGKPFLNGKLFIGIVNLEPEANPASIFSDRELTVALANPQTLNSRGQTTTKIYIAGRYSFKLENSAGSQIEQDLDRGDEVESQGALTLGDVTGINTITATADPTISGYVDKQQYTLTIASTNTDAVTLNIDSLGAITIQNQGQAIAAGDFVANRIIVVAYNSTTTIFELQSGGFTGALTQALITSGFPIQTSRATVAGTATASDIFAATVPNEIDFTGTPTVTDFPDAPTAGISRILHCASTPTFTNNANIFVPGGEDYTAKANDIITVHAITVSTFRLEIAADLNLSNLSTTGNDKIASSWVVFNAIGTVTVTDSFNVSSITDNGTGDFTINITSALPSINYLVAGNNVGSTDSFATTAYICSGGFVNTTTTYRINIRNSSAQSLLDMSVVGLMTMGG